MGRDFYTHRLAIELLPKPNFTSRPAPSGDERPIKIQKPNGEHAKSEKAALKKRQLQSQQKSANYIIASKDVWKPYWARV